MSSFLGSFLSFRQWMDFLFPKKRSDIDWKTIGQMRSRLKNMSLSQTVATQTAVVGTSRVMSTNFRSLSKQVTDRRGLKRWYGQDSVADAERELQEKIEAGQKAVEDLKQSGQYRAIQPEEAAALRQVQQKYMIMSSSAEEKLASFLSGDSDDINDLLFTNLGDAHKSIESIEIVPAAAPMLTPHNRFVNPLPSIQQSSDPDDTLRDIPVITEEMLASLEKSVAMDSITGSDHAVEALDECEVSADIVEVSENEDAAEAVCVGVGIGIDIDGGNETLEPSERRSKSSKSKSRKAKRAEKQAHDELPASNVTVFRPRSRNKK